MTNELKKDLTEALRGFFFEALDSIAQNAISSAIGKVLVDHGYYFVPLVVSPVFGGFKIRMDVDDKAYNIVVDTEGVDFDEIDS